MNRLSGEGEGGQGYVNLQPESQKLADKLIEIYDASVTWDEFLARLQKEMPDLHWEPPGGLCTLGGAVDLVRGDFMAIHVEGESRKLVAYTFHIPWY